MQADLGRRGVLAGLNGLAVEGAEVTTGDLRAAKGRSQWVGEPRTEATCRAGGSGPTHIFWVLHVLLPAHGHCA